jgi:hypothetical protein
MESFAIGNQKTQAQRAVLPLYPMFRDDQHVPGSHRPASARSHRQRASLDCTDSRKNNRTDNRQRDITRCTFSMNSSQNGRRSPCFAIAPDVANST